MAIVGKVKVGQTNRTAIVSSNFKPKPNVALTELSDTSLAGVSDGQVIRYNSATGKYEANTITATVTSVFGGKF
jgi:hypothetical protein